MKTKNTTRKIAFGKVFVDNIISQKPKILKRYKVKSLGVIKSDNVGLTFGVKQTVDN